MQSRTRRQMGSQYNPFVAFLGLEYLSLSFSLFQLPLASSKIELRAHKRGMASRQGDPSACLASRTLPRRLSTGFARSLRSCFLTFPVFSFSFLFSFLLEKLVLLDKRALKHKIPTKEKRTLHHTPEGPQRPSYQKKAETATSKQIRS